MNKTKGIFLEQETSVIPFRPVGSTPSIQFYGLIVKERSGKPFKGQLKHYYPGLSVSWLPFDDPERINKRKAKVSDFSPQFANTGFWAMIETLHVGDPLGEHRLEVYINDELYDVITFEVVTDK